MRKSLNPDLTNSPLHELVNQCIIKKGPEGPYQFTLPSSTSKTPLKWVFSSFLKKVPFETGNYLGKLGIKEEPGKKRVFAMVDPFTQ